VVIADRMRLVHEETSLSVEPDLMFVSTESVTSRRVRVRANDKGRILEVEGSPDVVLEVASDSSEAKDDRLEELYFAAGIQEYWRIDARGAEPRFEILRRGPRGFVAVPRRGGRIKSAVFGRSFQLRVTAGPIGIPKYTMDVSH
jgi:Uma2 family endonuclease